MTDKRVTLITASSEDEARTIAKTIVEERLAACVNIIPSIRSIYRWEGKICDDSESLLIVKTSNKSVEALEKRVAQLHSYSVPEIISLPIERGSEKYLAWIDENLND